MSLMRAPVSGRRGGCERDDMAAQQSRNAKINEVNNFLLISLPPFMKYCYRYHSLLVFILFSKRNKITR
jgi:hypothetical protein